MKRFLPRRTLFTIAFIIAILFFGNNSFSQSKTWDGGANTNNWGDANNWNPNGVPTVTNQVIIAGAVNVVVNIADATCASLQLNQNNNGTTTILTFNQGSKLIVNGPVAIGSSNAQNRKGSIMMSSGGTLVCHSIAVNQLDTWAPGIGTVELTSTNTLPSQFGTFNNLNINGGNLVLTAPQTIINGTLTQISGNINVGVNTLVINGTHIAYNNIVSGVSGKYTLTNTATLQTSNSGGIDGTITVTGTRTFESGSSYNFSSATSTPFPAIIATPFNIKNLTISNNVELNKAVNVSGTLTLTQGVVKTTATNLLTLNDNAVAPGASNASYIEGPMRKLGDDAFTFPIGANGNYAPITISGLEANDAFTAVYVPESAAKLGGIDPSASGLKRVSSCEYWDLDRTSGLTTPINVTLYWNADNACSGPNYINEPSTITIAHFNETSNTWDSYRGNGTGTMESGSVTWYGVSEFTPFTLATTSGINNPLPVRFSNVKASEKSNGVQIDFTNVTESDVEYYEVERSTDGKSFNAVKKLTPSKNDYNSASYKYLDASAIGGKNIYRIKAVETTGKIIYSNPVSITLGTKGQTMSVYASSGQVNVQVNSLPKGKYQFRVFSSLGQLIGVETINHEGGSLSQSTPLNNAKAGIYIYSINGQVNMQKRFLVQ